MNIKDWGNIAVISRTLFQHFICSLIQGGVSFFHLLVTPSFNHLLIHLKFIYWVPVIYHIPCWNLNKIAILLLSLLFCLEFFFHEYASLLFYLLSELLMISKFRNFSCLPISCYKIEVMIHALVLEGKRWLRSSCLFVFFFFEINVSMTDKGKAEQVHNR